MLVREPEGVTDLVDGRVDLLRMAGQIPSEIHRTVIATDPEVDDVAADVGPCAIAPHEPDADLRLVPGRHLVELQSDPEVFPGLERPAHDIFFCLVRGPGAPLTSSVGEYDVLTVGLSIEEVIVEPGAVDPLLLVGGKELEAMAADGGWIDTLLDDRERAIGGAFARPGVHWARCVLSGARVPFVEGAHRGSPFHEGSA